MSGVPKLLQPVGDELAIVWEDGKESYLKLTDVRRLCPCEGCAGERDLLGRVAKLPTAPLTERSFTVAALTPIGGYAVQIYWADGHSDGLYPYKKLREWSEHPPVLPALTVAPSLPVR
ncbi:MAG: DUF971 domain-containing protein [Acidobacteria bacterium]|nr:DUF971 domain-containing protein [Acidobacteriota bacterium]